MSIERESIEFDVLFVGGGPASLAGAIKLLQLALEKGKEGARRLARARAPTSTVQVAFCF